MILICFWNREDAQCDNFNIYAPDFIANALDNILQTKNYCKDED